MSDHTNQDNLSSSNENQEQEARQAAERRWAKFLNDTLGVLGFPLGLACLSSKTPSINAGLCLFFLFLIWLNNRRLMPRHFREPSAREFSARWRDNTRFWFGTAPALMGYIYLFLVASSYTIATLCLSKLQCGNTSHWIHLYVGAS